MGLIIKTPIGDIVFIEDVRVDNANGVPTPEEEEQARRARLARAAGKTREADRLVSKTAKSIVERVKPVPKRGRSR